MPGDRLGDMCAFDVGADLLVVDPAQAMAGDLVAQFQAGFSQLRLPLERHGHAKNGEWQRASLELAKDSPDADPAAVFVDRFHRHVPRARKRLGADDLGEEGLRGCITVQDIALAASTRGMSLIEADNEEAEASVIAALFRMTVEEPGKTAILVTPDRHLSRRVALKMRRWGILVDDSAGVPFANSPCGVFLRLVALFLEDPGDPVAILALLRHPLTQLGLLHGERERACDAIDRAMRGARPAKGLSSIEEKLRARESVDAGALAAARAGNRRGAPAGERDMALATSG